LSIVCDFAGNCIFLSSSQGGGRGFRKTPHPSPLLEGEGVFMNIKKSREIFNPLNLPAGRQVPFVRGRDLEIPRNFRFYFLYGKIPAKL